LLSYFKKIHKTESQLWANQYHQEMGKSKARAIWDACQEIALPKLLILLCVLAVFVPSFFMSGIPSAMFLPLSLSVGLSMIASFLLSQTLVPVLSNWLLKDRVVHDNDASFFNRFRRRYQRVLERIMPMGGVLALLYIVVSLVGVGLGFWFIGTRLERTEEATQQLLQLAQSITHNNLDITSAFVGTQPASYPVNLIHLWTSGPHEAVIKIKLKKEAELSIEAFKEQLRDSVKRSMPQTVLSFEPGDLVEQVLNLGSNNPIEILITGRNFSQTRKLAENLAGKLKPIDYLRDVQIATPLDYPGVKINIDRVKTGQMGLTVEQVTKSMVAATSSSRFTQPNYWLDKSSGTAYQIQVEYPQFRMNSADQLGLVPISGNAGAPVYLRDVATMQKTTSPGEYDRLNQQRFITITANISQKDVGSALKKVKETIGQLGELPSGVKVIVRGQSELLSQTMTELQSGLLIAIVVILLLLTVNFQSFKLSFAVLSIVPAVVAGALLLLTGNSLNIQSYMGTIMVVGVAVANAILFITNAEQLRRQNHLSDTAVQGASNRLRPILMTGLAMMAGMIPMSLGLGEGGDQTAPLAIAVIGGLLFSTISTLLFLPLIYRLLMGKQAFKNASLDPNDPQSGYFESR